MKRFLVAVMVLIFVMTFSAEVFAKDESRDIKNWNDLIEYFRSVVIYSDWEKTSFREVFYEAMDLLGHYGTSRIEEVEKIEGLKDVLHTDSSGIGSYKELQARVDAVDKETQREFMEILKKYYKLSENEGESIRFQRIFRTAFYAGLISESELSEIKELHSAKGFKDFDEFEIHSSFYDTIDEHKIKPEAGEFQVPSFMYESADEAQNEMLEYGYNEKVSDFNGMLEKKAAFDSFKQEFLADFLRKEESYRKKALDGEMPAEPPNQAEVFQRIYDEAIKTNFFDKRDLKNGMTAYFLMNRADRVEVCFEVLDKLIKEKFFDRLRYVFYPREIYDPYPVVTVDENGNRIYTKREYPDFEVLFKAFLNSGILPEEKLLKIKEKVLVSDAGDPAVILIQELKPYVLEHENAILKTGESNHDLFKTRDHSGRVRPYGYNQRANFIYPHSSWDNKIAWGVPLGIDNDKVNCYGFASQFLKPINPGYFSGRSIRVQTDIGILLVPIEQIRDCVIEDMRHKGYSSVRPAGDEYDVRDGEILIAVRKGVLDYYSGIYPVEDYHFVVVQNRTNHLGYLPGFHKPERTRVLRAEFTISKDWRGWPMEAFLGFSPNGMQNWIRCTNYDYDGRILYIAFRK